MVNNSVTHTQIEDRMKIVNVSIYHNPSVFFSELVERDLGLRMILMFSRSRPHTLALLMHTHI